MTKTYGQVRHCPTDKRWEIEAEPHILLRMKRVFERIYKGSHGRVMLSDTPENCQDLYWFCQRYPLAMPVRARRLLWRRGQEHKEHVLRLEQLIDSSYTPAPVEMAIAPREYQRRANEVYLSQGHLLLVDELGLGKSCSAICSFTDPRTLPAVVVAYPHLQRQWAKEIEKFLPDLFVHVVKTGKPYELPRWLCENCRGLRKPKRLRDEEDDLLPVVCRDERCGRGPDVVIVTYTKLSGWAETLAAYSKSVVFDEIQELRHHDSQKYQAARHLAKSCDFREGLTATPIFNYGGEMFNILEILAPGTLGTRDEFSREWCRGGGDKLKIHDPPAFGSYLRENFLMLRRTRADVGRELPRVIRTPYHIDCDTSELDKIEDSAAELARIILAKGETFKGQRLQASEELSNLVRQATGIAKAPYAADFVRLLVESGDKVLLCGWHRAVYEIWAAKLKDLRIGWYTGSESPAAKEKTKADAMAGEIDVIFMSLRSGAGLDGLQGQFKTIAFGELDWSPAVHEQAIGRLHRDGQDTNVNAFFLLSEGGSDPIMADVLGIKRNQLEGIRSPTADPIEALATDTGKIKKLAEFYLSRRRQFAAKAGAA